MLAESPPPHPPPVPAALRREWPVIAVGALAWAVAAAAAFLVPSLESWRPVTIAGLGVGLLGTTIFLWQRGAAHRGARGAQTGLSARSTRRGLAGKVKVRSWVMAAPLLQTQIEINAPVSRVWELISDFGRMPEWSPQCRAMRPLGAVRAGTKTINLNRRGVMFWPTTSTITEVIPEKKLAFRVNTNGTTWSYELEPTETGTRVIESRHADDGTKAVSRMLVKAFMGGADSFDSELVDGMNESLARIKGAAEH